MSSTVERGYGKPHQRRRAAWAPRVAAGIVPCRRCGLLIPAGAPWDLGHDDFDRGLPPAPEHAACNRAAAARRRNRGFRRVSPIEAAERAAAAWAERENAYWARVEVAAGRPAPRPRIY